MVGKKSRTHISLVGISSKGNESSFVTLNDSKVDVNGCFRCIDGEIFKTYKRRRIQQKPPSPQDQNPSMEITDLSTSQVMGPQEKILLNNSCSSVTAFDNFPAKAWNNIIMEQVCEQLSQSGSSSLNTSRESFISTPLSTHVHNDKEFYHYKAGMHKCTSKKRVQGPHNVTGRPDVVSNDVLEIEDHNGNATLCHRAFMNILASEEFRLMCSRLHENFGGVEVDKFFDFDLVISRIMHGAYGCSPVLFSYDIEQVWSSVRKVLREMLSIVNDLSECSKACYAELFRGSFTDTCSEGGKHELGTRYHQPESGECSVPTMGPKLGRNPGPKTRCCERCTFSPVGSDHDNCIVCARMNPEPGSLLTGRPEDDRGGIPDGDGLADGYSSYRCGICRGMAEVGEKLRVCSHPHCFTKYYHPRCLTAKESGSYGPLWYCPSCLCRRCLVDQDDALMVLCDGCNQGYHIYCMDPPLGNVPRGRWFCRSCGEGLCRLMAARAGFRVEEAEKRNARAERRVYTHNPGSTRGVHQVVVVGGKKKRAAV